jgi:hypothetical protein
LAPNIGCTWFLFFATFFPILSLLFDHSS